MTDNGRILKFLNELQNSQNIEVKCKNNESLKCLYDKFTRDYSLLRARTLSKEERQANHLTSNSLSYGEIDFNSLQLAINEVAPQRGGIFYDLGSGIGKGVIAASLMHQFDVCKGIELLHSLHEQACKLQSEVEEQKYLIYEQMEQQGMFDYQFPKIEFINDDFRKLDWSDGTLLFASTTCFDPDLMKDLSKKASQLKYGTHFITVTRMLEPQSEWRLINQFIMGTSNFIYIRKKNDLILTINNFMKKGHSNNHNQHNPHNPHNELFDYLKQENKQLQEQIQELKNLLSLNKKALKIMTPTTNDEQNKGLLMVLKNLQEENAKLHTQIDRLVEERNEAQNQVLINQQITEEAQRHEKELIMSLQNKIQNLQFNLNKTEQKLCKMEQLKPEYDEISGIVIKYKEVCEPDKVAMKFHNQIEMINEQLIIQLKQNKKIESEKQKLQGLNLKLMSNLVQMKSTAMTYHGNKLILQQSSEPKPQELLKFQNNLLNVLKKEEDEHSSSSSHISSAGSSPLMSPLPLKQENQVAKQMKEVPKLDLTKAKQIQEINAKRQIQQMQDMKKQSDPGLLDKCNKLERALEEIRKNYQREMLLNKSLEIANNQLQRQCDELENQISLLINSNIRHQEKLKKINKQYCFLQQFYINNKDQFTTTQSHNRRFSQTPTDLSQEINLDTSFIEANEAIISNEMQEHQILQQQIYQLQQQQQQSQQFNLQNFYQYYVPNNADDSKKFLLGLAESIYSGLQEKLDQIQQTQCQREKTYRFRSVSDIIDYQHSGLQQYTCQQQQ